MKCGLSDLRLLLRLPVPELEPNVGCNLTTAAMLLNLVSGFSVWFFEADEGAVIRADEARDGHPYSKRRFLGFVTTYWPQVEPEGDPLTSAERLYEIRNSLVHDLGAHDDPEREQPKTVKLAKAPHTLDEIVTSFERNMVHPLNVPVIEEMDNEYTIHLAGLY